MWGDTHHHYHNYHQHHHHLMMLMIISSPSPCSGQLQLFEECELMRGSHHLCHQHHDHKSISSSSSTSSPASSSSSFATWGMQGLARGLSLLDCKRTPVMIHRPWFTWVGKTSKHLTKHLQQMFSFVSSSSWDPPFQSATIQDLLLLLNLLFWWHSFSRFPLLSIVKHNHHHCHHIQ